MRKFITVKVKVTFNQLPSLEPLVTYKVMSICTDDIEMIESNSDNTECSVRLFKGPRLVVQENIMQLTNRINQVQLLC